MNWKARQNQTNPHTYTHTRQAKKRKRKHSPLWAIERHQPQQNESHKKKKLLPRRNIFHHDTVASMARITNHLYYYVTNKAGLHTHNHTMNASFACMRRKQVETYYTTFEELLQHGGHCMTSEEMCCQAFPSLFSLSLVRPF